MIIKGYNKSEIKKEDIAELKVKIFSWGNNSLQIIPLKLMEAEGFFFFIWKVFTLWNYDGFYHTTTWISH